MNRDRVAELCRRLRPIVGRRADLLWTAYIFETEAAGRAEIEQTLEILAARHLGTSYEPDREPFTPPPERFAAAGELELGQVVYAGRSRGPYRLKSDRLTRHALICGSSGAGKTNATFVLADAVLCDDQAHLLALDWKRSYRQLLQKHPGLLVYTVGRSVSPVGFNLLIPPPGTEPQLWLKLIIDVIASAYFGGEGVISLLTAGLDAIYGDCFDEWGRMIRTPRPTDLLAWLHGRKVTGRAALWKSSAERIVQSLCHGAFGEVLNANHNGDIERLLDRNVILEMDGLGSNADRQLFAQALTLYLYRLVLARGPHPGLRNLMILEEAHHLLLEGSGSQGGAQENPLTNAIRMAREYGLGFVFVDQSPSLLSRVAFANTYATIALNQKLAQDVRAMASSMNLSDVQRQALNTLTVGTAVVRVADDHPEPFLIRFPRFDLDGPSIDDQVVRQSTAAARGDPTDSTRMSAAPPVRSDLSAIPPEHKRDSLPPAPHPTNHPPVTEPSSEVPHPPPPETEAGTERDRDLSRHPDPESAEISREVIRFLVDVAEHPLSTTVARYQRLHLSRRRGNSIRQELTDSGLIEPVRLSTRSGQVVLHELTDDGRDLCRRLGAEVPPRPRTSLAHAFWTLRAARHFEREGFEVTREHHVDGNGWIDLLAVDDHRRLHIEVETGRSDIEANLTKASHAEFDRLVVVATCPEAVALVEKEIAQLDATIAAKVDLMTWLDFD